VFGNSNQEGSKESFNFSNESEFEMESLIQVLLLVIVLIACFFVHLKHQTKVVKQIAFWYHHYNNAFEIMQRFNNSQKSLVAEISSGSYGHSSQHVIARYREDVLARFSSWTDSQILEDEFKREEARRKDMVRELIRCYSKMREIGFKSRFFDPANHLLEIANEIESGDHDQFTIHNYSDWGNNYEQPDFSSSLRWELEMIFVKGHIPREKNYGEGIS
jgi:hypothetical protein